MVGCNLFELGAGDAIELGGPAPAESPVVEERASSLRGARQPFDLQQEIFALQVEERGHDFGLRVWFMRERKRGNNARRALEST